METLGWVADIMGEGQNCHFTQEDVGNRDQNDVILVEHS